MAGDWTPRVKGLNRKPEVLAVARATGLGRRVVADTLMDFWDWADDQTEDGWLPGVALAQLTEVIPDTSEAFWAALAQAGWLQVEPGGLRIPNFARWMGNSGKRRLNKNARQARWRAPGQGRGGRHENVDAQAPTEAPTTEPNRIGEESPSTPLARSSAGADSGQDPPHRCSAEETSNSPGDPDAALLTFPTVGGGPKEWHLRRSKLAEYAVAYPALDVLAEARRALQWLRDHPRNRKTPRRMPAFLNGWMGRAQNQARPGPPPRPPPTPEERAAEELRRRLQREREAAEAEANRPAVRALLDQKLPHLRERLRGKGEDLGR